MQRLARVARHYNAGMDVQAMLQELRPREVSHKIVSYVIVSTARKIGLSNVELHTMLAQAGLPAVASSLAQDTSENTAGAGDDGDNRAARSRAGSRRPSAALVEALREDPSLSTSAVHGVSL